MNFSVRGLRAGDVDAVFALERSAADAAHWRQEEYWRLAEPSAARGVQWIGSVAVVQSRLVGFVAGRVVLHEADLENMAVAPEMRRQGIAAALVGDFLRECRHRGCVVVRLEVREGNAAARSLYLRARFREEARRKNYYRDPQEDALTFVRHL